MVLHPHQKQALTSLYVDAADLTERSTGALRHTILAKKMGTGKTKTYLASKKAGEEVWFRPSLTMTSVNSIYQTYKEVKDNFPSFAMITGRVLVLTTYPTWSSRTMTVVVLPLRALAEDACRRLARYDIDAIVWSDDRPPLARSSVILIRPESLTAQAWLAYAAILKQKRVVDLVVIDEAHMVLDRRNNFRPSFD
ncbi:hypothetical protein QQZ08_010770 [Neonectria magnoliae]|uniref:DNA 3'-5' helicase n=1 Tax=Neonectria magnoliae TaxID=2732573 RepID=A0ABR1HER5_9HYPO